MHSRYKTSAVEAAGQLQVLHVDSASRCGTPNRVAPKRNPEPEPRAPRVAAIAAEASFRPARRPRPPFETPGRRQAAPGSPTSRQRRDARPGKPGVTGPAGGGGRRAAGGRDGAPARGPPAGRVLPGRRPGQLPVLAGQLREQRGDDRGHRAVEGAGPQVLGA